MVMQPQKRHFGQNGTDSGALSVDKKQKMAKRIRRRLPAELCAELVACISPFALQYGTSRVCACLARKGAIGPISAQFDAFRRERLDKISKKKLMYIWLQVFGFIARFRAGERACMASRSFAVIGHTRLHERCALFPYNNTRIMRRIEITDTNTSNLPMCSLPENIVAIEQIEIRYLDFKVLDFVKHIQPLLLRGLRIRTYPLKYSPANIVAIEHILSLCTGAIFAIGIWIEDFVKFLAECPQLFEKCLSLGVSFYSKVDFTEIPKLVNWLAEAKEDGKPKCVFCYGKNVAEYYELLIGQIKGHFLTTTAPSSFLVQMDLLKVNVNEFCEQQPRTGEQLALEVQKNSTALVTRHSIARMPTFEAYKQKILNWNFKNYGNLTFHVQQIGDLVGNNDNR